MTIPRLLGALVWLTCARPTLTLGGDVPPTHVLTPDKRNPGDRFPLAVYLHGLGGSGADAIADPAVEDLARRGRMFVVAPDGELDRQGRRFWNAGGACCNFERAGVDDLARLTALIDSWRNRPDVDPRRIYVVGFSNGGFMAHRLGCRIGDRLAAVVSIAGAGPEATEPCQPTSPLAVLEIHGDADPIVRYQGGRVFDSPQLTPHPSAPHTIRSWAKRLRCGDKGPQKEKRGSQIAVEAIRACPLGSAELWTVLGGGHHLMTSPILDQVGSFLTAQVKPLSRRP